MYQTSASLDIDQDSPPLPTSPNLGTNTSPNADPETCTLCQPEPGSQALDESQSESGSDPTVVEASNRAVPSNLDLAELSELAQLDDIKLAMRFIRALEIASLDDEMGLDPETIEYLRDAPQFPVETIDPDLRLSLDLFLSVSNSSQETYTSARKAILRRHPEDSMLSYDQIKRRVAQLSGIVPVVFDMCINSCIAYTCPQQTRNMSEMWRTSVRRHEASCERWKKISFPPGVPYHANWPPITSTWAKSRKCSKHSLS